MNRLVNPYFGTGNAKPSLTGWSQDKGYWEANHKPSNLGPFGTALRMADSSGPGGGSFPYNDAGSIWQVVAVPPHFKVDIGVRQIQHSMPEASGTTYLHKLLQGSLDGDEWVRVLLVELMDTHDVRQADDWSNVTYSTRNLPLGGFPFYRLTLTGRIASNAVNANAKIAEAHLVLDSTIRFHTPTLPAL